MFVCIWLHCPVSFALLFERKWRIQTLIVRPQTYADRMLFCVTGTRTGDVSQFQTGRAQRPLADEEHTIWTGRHVQLSAKRMKRGNALTCHTVSAPGNHSKWVDLDDRVR